MKYFNNAGVCISGAIFNKTTVPTGQKHCRDFLNVHYLNPVQIQLGNESWNEDFIQYQMVNFFGQKFYLFQI